MARPLKEGIDYFPLDTGYMRDEDIRIIRSEFGLEGELLLMRIWCMIYEEKGYYKRFSDRSAKLMAESLGRGWTYKRVNDFVKECVEYGLFDKALYKAYGVLTSAGIQRRYLRAVISRESITLIREYCLVSESVKGDIPACVLPKLEVVPLCERERERFLLGNQGLLISYPQRRSEEIISDQRGGGARALSALDGLGRALSALDGRGLATPPSAPPGVTRGSGDTGDVGDAGGLGDGPLDKVMDCMGTGDAGVTLTKQGLHSGMGDAGVVGVALTERVLPLMAGDAQCAVGSGLDQGEETTVLSAACAAQGGKAHIRESATPGGKAARADCNRRETALPRAETARTGTAMSRTDAGGGLPGLDKPWRWAPPGSLAGAELALSMAGQSGAGLGECMAGGRMPGGCTTGGRTPSECMPSERMPGGCTSAPLASLGMSLKSPAPPGNQGTPPYRARPDPRIVRLQQMIEAETNAQGGGIS